MTLLVTFTVSETHFSFKYVQVVVSIDVTSNELVTMEIASLDCQRIICKIYGDPLTFPRALNLVKVLILIKKK